MNTDTETKVASESTEGAAATTEEIKTAEVKTSETQSNTEVIKPQESKKAEAKPQESKKAEAKPQEPKKTEANKPQESKKAEVKPQESKKSEAKKSEAKKAEAKSATKLESSYAFNTPISIYAAPTSAAPCNKFVGSVKVIAEVSDAFISVAYKAPGYGKAVVGYIAKASLK